MTVYIFIGFNHHCYAGIDLVLKSLLPSLFFIFGLNGYLMFNVLIHLIENDLEELILHSFYYIHYMIVHDGMTVHSHDIDGLLKSKGPQCHSRNCNYPKTNTTDSKLYKHLGQDKQVVETLECLTGLVIKDRLGMWKNLGRLTSQADFAAIYRTRSTFCMA